MKSIYLRNFVATATMVSVCFLLIAFSFVFIGRNYVISEYRSDMEASAKEVSRTASAIAAAISSEAPPRSGLFAISWSKLLAWVPV